MSPETFPPLAYGDMQWQRADGSAGTYTGPLLDLGVGIPRHLPDHGIRRALFDLAFGYVSGFPVRDIVPFAIRSLRPAPDTPTASIAYSGDEDRDDAGS